MSIELGRWYLLYEISALHVTQLHPFSCTADHVRVPKSVTTRVLVFVSASPRPRRVAQDRNASPTSPCSSSCCFKGACMRTAMALARSSGVFESAAGQTYGFLLPDRWVTTLLVGFLAIEAPGAYWLRSGSSSSFVSRPR